MKVISDQCSVSRIDLGLAILSAITPPGARRSLVEIAAFCDCSKGYIHAVERKGLAKLRRRLLRDADPVLRDLLEHVTGRKPDRAEEYA